MIYIIFIVAIFFMSCYFFIGNYFFNIALNPQISKKYILRCVTEEDREDETKSNIYGKKWIREFAEEIKILSSDNLILNGYKIINPIEKSDVWVILVHGYMGSSYEMVEYAKEFINERI